MLLIYLGSYNSKVAGTVRGTVKAGARIIAAFTRVVCDGRSTRILHGHDKERAG